MHLDDVTFQLVLTDGQLLDGLPQRSEALHHLLHLGWVEGDGAGCFRRDGFWSSGFGAGRCPTCWIALAIICFAAGDQPSSGAPVTIICLVASP